MWAPPRQPQLRRGGRFAAFLGGSSRAALFRSRTGGTLGSLGGEGEKGPLGLPSLSEDSRRTARMRSACWLTAELAAAGSGSGSSSELLLELSEVLSADSSSAGSGGTGTSRKHNGWSPGVQGLLGAFLLRWWCRSRWGFSAFSFAPFLSARPASAASRVPRVFFFFHSPSFQWYSGGGLSHQARPFFRGGSSRARLPLAGSCAGDLGRRLESLLAAWRSFQAATPSQPCHGSVGSCSPDPRPRIASCCAGPSPGRLAARCPVASSSAGLVRWFPTSSETANGLDSSPLLLCPFWTWFWRGAVPPASRRVGT